MPSYDEVRSYLIGLWLLIKGDARGLRPFDISDRGVARSFWALAWAFPVLALSGIYYRSLYLEEFPEATEPALTYIAKAMLVDMAAWFLPIVALMLAAPFLKIRLLLRTLIVVWNWASMAALYFGSALVILLLSLPEPQDESWVTIAAFGWIGAAILLLALSVALFWRILRTIVGGSVLIRLQVFAVVSLPMLLLEPLEKQLGIYVP
ncbi:hypothetical protein [Neorhizobium alkalisoli]|uniref:hypothetical protein n=1 Tax=Neorhizobium alkalisoli TaxID=528178 RepID=UPI000CFA07A4|nr:hypothetical protein [Neorhizobium alkalisoli]